MRKKSGLTMARQAIVLVPEFEKVVGRLDQQVALRGQSKSTLDHVLTLKKHKTYHTSKNDNCISLLQNLQNNQKRALSA
jgi:hypothetical protein